MNKVFPGAGLGHGIGLEEMSQLARALREIAAEEAAETQIALAWLARNLVCAERLTVKAASAQLRALMPGAPNVKRRGAPADRSFCRALAAVCIVWSGECADPTAGATLAHRHDEMPAWAEHAKGTALIGPWMFYRPR